MRGDRDRGGARAAGVAAVLLAAAISLACGGKASRPPEVTCDTAAMAYVRHRAAQLEAGDRLPAYAETVAALCVQRGWPAPVRACLGASADLAGADACLPDTADRTQLSDALQKRRGDLAMPTPAPPPPPPPPSPSPPPQ